MSSAGKVSAAKIELKTLLKYFESFRSLPFSPSFFFPIDFIFLYRLNKHEMILIPFPRNESKGKFYFMTTRGSCREFRGVLENKIKPSSTLNGKGWKGRVGRLEGLSIKAGSNVEKLYGSMMT